MSRPTVAIIGAGRVGTAIGIRLRRAGYPIGGVVCRTTERAEEAVRLIGGGRPFTDPVQAAWNGHIVFFTVPDEAIKTVATDVLKTMAGESGGRFRAAFSPDSQRMDGEAAVPSISRPVWIHTSGALGTEVFSAADCAPPLPIARLSMHPVQTIADPQRAVLDGIYWGVEGDEEALTVGHELIRAMDGHILRIRAGKKALYHTAAVLSSNYMMVLIDVGLRLLQEAGIPKEEGEKVLAELMQGAARNVKETGIPAALTGPIERGDRQTILSHLEALQSLSQERNRKERSTEQEIEDQIPTRQPDDGDDEPWADTETLYRMLGRYTLALARRKNHRAVDGAARGGGDQYSHQDETTDRKRNRYQHLGVAECSDDLAKRYAAIEKLLSRDDGLKRHGQ